MIKSIEFTGNTNGYIKKKKYKIVPKKGVNQEEFDKILEETHGRGLNFEKISKTVQDGYACPWLIKNLLKKKFEFCPDKINILFGPNASGKTTILKTIAAYTMCGSSSTDDGFTNPFKYDPLHIGFSKILDGEKITADEIQKQVARHAGNEAIVDWDGALVYYENLSSRRSNFIGDLVGGIFQDLDEEFMYRMNEDRMSSGQKSIMIFNKLEKICKTPSNLQEVIDEGLSRKMNDVWKDNFKAQVEYYNRYHKEDASVMTVLLDELDKSLDILNVLALYTKALPRLKDKFNIQLIVVSHSPIVLTSNIYDNPLYNVISLDKKYTKECKNQLGRFSF